MLQNDRIIFDLSIFLFYHDVATFIRTFLLIPFVSRSFILPVNSYSGYFTLILFVSLAYVICFILARLLPNLWGLMLLYRSVREAAVPNQWNIQIISISFFTHRSLFREKRSCALEAILAILMVCIIHIGEPNRNPTSTYDAIFFHADIHRFKKNSLPFWCYEKTFIVPKRYFSHIVCIPTSILIINHSRVQPPIRRYFPREVSRKFR